MSATESELRDPALVGEVDLARAAAQEEAGDEEVGAHVGTHVEADTAVTHLFEAGKPGYHGWRWAVTVASAGPDTDVTISEVVLLPGPLALVAPDWVPWENRVQAGDLGVGDLFPTAPDDPRLVPAYVESDDPAVEDVAREAGLGRPRVMARPARLEAAERWQHSEFGPRSDMARSAPAHCGTCGFYLPLAGSLRAAFGTCGNEISPADGRVVHAEYGCGAHSEAEVEQVSPVLVANLIYDDARLDVEPIPTPAEAAAPAEAAIEAAQPETAGDRATGAPAAEAAIAETPTAERAADEAAAGETAITETPAAEIAGETIPADTLDAEAPAADQASGPAADQATSESLAAEAAIAETPAADDAAPEAATAAVDEAPATDQTTGKPLAAEAAIAETPAAEEAAASGTAASEVPAAEEAAPEAAGETEAGEAPATANGESLAAEAAIAETSAAEEAADEAAPAATGADHAAGEMPAAHTAEAAPGETTITETPAADGAIEPQAADEAPETTAEESAPETAAEEAASTSEPEEAGQAPRELSGPEGVPPASEPVAPLEAVVTAETSIDAPVEAGAPATLTPWIRPEGAARAGSTAPSQDTNRGGLLSGGLLSGGLLRGGRTTPTEPGADDEDRPRRWQPSFRPYWMRSADERRTEGD